MKSFSIPRRLSEPPCRPSERDDQGPDHPDQREIEESHRPSPRAPYGTATCGARAADRTVTRRRLRRA